MALGRPPQQDVEPNFGEGVLYKVDIDEARQIQVDEAASLPWPRAHTGPPCTSRCGVRRQAQHGLRLREALPIGKTARDIGHGGGPPWDSLIVSRSGGRPEMGHESGEGVARTICPNRTDIARISELQLPCGANLRVTGPLAVHGPLLRYLISREALEFLLGIPARLPAVSCPAPTLCERP